MKIKFTTEHYARLRELACKMLFNNGEIQNKMNFPLNISELLHTTSINQLSIIMDILSKKIEAEEKKDSWLDPNEEKINNLKQQKELVNLIIGWKRWNLEALELASKKKELLEKKEELLEAEKTPADKLQEIEAALAALDKELE